MKLSLVLVLIVLTVTAAGNPIRSVAEKKTSKVENLLTLLKLREKRDNCKDVMGRCNRNTECCSGFCYGSGTGICLINEDPNYHIVGNCLHYGDFCTTDEDCCRICEKRGSRKRCYDEYLNHGLKLH